MYRFIKTSSSAVLALEREHAMSLEAKKIADEAAKERHEALASALVAALSDLTVVDTARTANAGSYSYKYADVGDVVKLTRPVLAAHGLVALTPVHAHGDGLACTVILLHTSGERLELGPFPFPHGRDAQATGSMVTYHRRYALVAALGMAAGDDDDGQSAAPRERGEPAVKPSPNASQTCALCDKPLNDGKPLVKGESGYVHKACLTADENAAKSPSEPSGPEGKDKGKQETMV